MELLTFPHKKLRATVIKEYMLSNNFDKCVCFTCGNASKELKNLGVDCLAIGPNEDLIPNKWFTQEEIKKYFPTCFDATSGHLSIPLMKLLGNTYKNYLGDLPKVVYLPCGSGETLICLKFAYPDINFIAVYNLNEATKFEDEAPLNELVNLLAYDIIK